MFKFLKFFFRFSITSSYLLVFRYVTISLRPDHSGTQKNLFNAGNNMGPTVTKLVTDRGYDIALGYDNDLIVLNKQAVPKHKV